MNKLPPLKMDELFMNLIGLYLSSDVNALKNYCLRLDVSPQGCAIDEVLCMRLSETSDYTPLTTLDGFDVLDFYERNHFVRFTFPPRNWNALAKNLRINYFKLMEVKNEI